MRVSKLYIYPIKSLRPCEQEQAELGRHGFRYDRRFMLMKVLDDGSYENMHVSTFNEMVLFTTQIDLEDGQIHVTFNPANATSSSTAVPLQPTVDELEAIQVQMHGSPTSAYKMGEAFNDWFSERFGFPVILVFLGDNRRHVLMSTSPSESTSTGWLGAISSRATAIMTALRPAQKEHITFADCAPYLIVSERSLDDVHHRLDNGERMDVTKFRPNIVVADAETPWEEDFWGELTFNDDTKIECVHNCVRCVSLNVDYATGKPGTSSSGKILAKLQKDRRVDSGGKYSPVFGRYSFLQPSSEGHIVRVGDTVSVSRVNEKRTTFGE